MLAWLRRRREECRRKIFRYWDGARWRRCDPIEAMFRLQSHPRFDHKLHPILVDEGDREAIEITCEAVRQAFGVPAFDSATSAGLTVGETLDLLCEFCLYLEGLKKSTGQPVTSPLPTEPTPTASNAPTTSDSSVSGSTGTAPNCDTPTECGSP